MHAVLIDNYHLHAFFIFQFLLLMLFSQQIINCLNRIKCTQRYFYEYCTPVAH